MDKPVNQVILGQNLRSANQVMNSIEINNLFFFLNYCLFNYMITKIGYLTT